jgi:hypothetical protein
MPQKKSLSQREQELRTMMATAAGRTELQELASRYSAASGRVRAERASVITYILIHERLQGLISG